MNKNSFKQDIVVKLVQNLLSVKVWIIFSVLTISTTLVLLKLMDASIWGATNGGIVSTVCAMREIFKIEKIKNIKENTDLIP